MSVSRGRTLRANGLGRFALIGSMIEFIAFVALVDWPVFFNVYVIVGNDLGEEFQTCSFYVFCLLFCGEFDFEHVGLFNDLEVLDGQ